VQAYKAATSAVFEKSVSTRSVFMQDCVLITNSKGRTG
jgi:hypothetical protein